MTSLPAVQPTRLFALLQEAVACYSPSYHEAPATEVFARALTRAGLRVERHPVAPGRENLWVSLGPEPAELVWVGHVDTVVRQDRSEIGPRIQGDLLYGLGAADMKSGCAAAVEAFIALAEHNPHPARGVALALVVGEEEYGDGAEALLARLHEPLIVIGEPTDLRLCADHYGYLELRLLTGGTQVHAALPHHGDNAIHAMLSWLQSSIEVAEDPDMKGLRANPRQISGGGAMFIVPARCEATLDLHIPPGEGALMGHRAVALARERAAALHGGCSFQAEELFWAQGFKTPLDDPRLRPALDGFARLGLDPRLDAFPSHSDASLLHSAGCATVVCGPGRLEVAHTHDEHVSLSQTLQAAQLYAAMFDAVARGDAAV